MKVSPMKCCFLAFVVLAISTSDLVAGQSQACSTTFFSSLVQLMPCRPAVAAFGATPPSEACCNAIRLLGQPCLCAITNGPPIAGVDRSMALQLPSKCSVNFAPCA